MAVYAGAVAILAAAGTFAFHFIGTAALRQLDAQVFVGRDTLRAENRPNSSSPRDDDQPKITEPGTISRAQFSPAGAIDPKDSSRVISAPITPHSEWVGRRQPQTNYSSAVTYRTVCVRLCDGAYFPISFATTARYFNRDRKACTSRCSSPSRLFVTPTYGGNAETMVDLEGQSYAALANALKFRTEYSPQCSCKPQAHIASLENGHEGRHSDAITTLLHGKGMLANLELIASEDATQSTRFIPPLRPVTTVIDATGRSVRIQTKARLARSPRPIILAKVPDDYIPGDGDPRVTALEPQLMQVAARAPASREIVASAPALATSSLQARSASARQLAKLGLAGKSRTKLLEESLTLAMVLRDRDEDWRIRIFRPY